MDATARVGTDVPVRQRRSVSGFGLIRCVGLWDVWRLLFDASAQLLSLALGLHRPKPGGVHERVAGLPGGVAGAGATEHVRAASQLFAPALTLPLSATRVADVVNGADRNLSEFPPHSVFTLSRMIRLSRNRISAVPDTIGDACLLQELAVSENQLDELPAALFTLPCLRVLDARRNRLLALPDALAQCVSLQKLFLSHNRLTKLPAVDYAPLVHLRSLSLRENQVRGRERERVCVCVCVCCDTRGRSRHCRARLPPCQRWSRLT